MTPRQAITQAKESLINSRELNSILNQTGEVRVPVLPDLAVMPMRAEDATPANDPALFVTFTIEETGFGKRLMVEFQGYKEFAA